MSNLLIENNISLADITTLRVGGPAKYLIRIKNKEDLISAYNFAKEKRAPIFILGGGTNILVSDTGFDGVVLKIEIKGIDFQNNAGKIFTRASAGESWDSLVSQAVDKKYWGIENLSGIPGTVGASVIQNIGAYGSEIKDRVMSVDVFDMRDQTFKVLEREECFFEYRESLFKRAEGKHYVVVAVNYLLSADPIPNISYKDLSNYFNAKQIAPELHNIRTAVLEIRSGKLPDIKTTGTAGSFFKNIVVDIEKYEDLKNHFKEMVAFDYLEGTKKISTAYILDKLCGLKGYREGNVGLHTNQPLVLVNYGKNNATEVKKFVKKIKQIVFDKTTLKIEEEVVVV